MEIKVGDIVTTFRPELAGRPLRPWEWCKVKQVYSLAGVLTAGLYRPSTKYKASRAVCDLYIVPDNLIAYE